ncbi:MAG: glycosyltransferase [Rhodothermia bacterium]|nr:glycosyltransferase [Rhodothermia bacterium]
MLKFNWWFGGHRPPRLHEFSRRVLEVCRSFRPRWLLCTGIAPVARWALKEVAQEGILRINFLTDDPWNPAHRAPWFGDALPQYDRVFSPRRSNLEDLKRIGCPQVAYLPFAYDPAVHYPDPPCTTLEWAQFASDIVFIGGADRDRLPVITALIRAGFRVALYGGYWDRLPETRAYARGHADPYVLRKAVGGAKVVLCLVRRANRDGHAMRTYEIPAMRACMLTEDTAEHRDIFGEEGRAVLYFRTIAEMLDKLRWLLDHPEERVRLAEGAYRLITDGSNTYANRLAAMLGARTIS